MDVYLKKLEDELRLRKYSPKTVKAYSACVENYLRAKKDSFGTVDIDFIKQYKFASDKLLLLECFEI